MLLLQLPGCLPGGRTVLHVGPWGLGQGPRGLSGGLPSVSGAAAQRLIAGAGTTSRGPGRSSSAASSTHRRVQTRSAGHASA